MGTIFDVFGVVGPGWGFGSGRWKMLVYKAIFGLEVRNALTFGVVEGAVRSAVAEIIILLTQKMKVDTQGVVIIVEREASIGALG